MRKFLQMSKSPTTDSLFTKASFQSGVWTTEPIPQEHAEPQNPAVSSIMSQAIPPSVMVPVPHGKRSLQQKELDELPFALVMRLAHLCRASYWSVDRIRSDKRFIPELSGELQSGFPKLIESSDPHNPAAHLWLFRETRSLVVVLRGVGSVGESMINLSASFSAAENGQIHAGLMAQFQALESIIRTELQSIRHAFNSLVLTGHGIGGALATVSLPHFASMCPETKFSCITFGSPRVGDSAFKQWYNTFQLQHNYRFVLEDDPLPMFPSNNRFVHCLDAVCLRHDGRFEFWPETTPPRWEIPFGSLVMYIVSVFEHMQWEYDDQFSHACAIAIASHKRRGG